MAEADRSFKRREWCCNLSVLINLTVCCLCQENDANELRTDFLTRQVIHNLIYHNLHADASKLSLKSQNRIKKFDLTDSKLISSRCNGRDGKEIKKIVLQLCLPLTTSQPVVCLMEENEPAELRKNSLSDVL